MRYGILSDVHSNLEALDAVIKAYQKEGIDKYICVGDIVGYAANPIECIEKIKSQSPITVAGNHDWASVSLLSIDYFNPAARQAILWTKHNLDAGSRYFLESLKLIYENEDLVLVHGTLDAPQDFNYMIDIGSAQETLRIFKGNICFVGHTHICGIFIEDKNGRIHYEEEEHIVVEDENKYIINVGSVGQPRDGNPKAAYCIYDTEKKEINIKRVDYNVEAARKKVIEAGLARFLGDRLLVGQ
jgi:predicted phosphodiesterase